MYLVTGGMHPERMPSWPELLAKYNLILSQTHSFSNSLVNPLPATTSTSRIQQQNAEAQQNIFQKIVIHPVSGVLDVQMDTEIAPLLRNQQTIDVLRQENETVRRLSEHMATRGMLGVLGLSNPEEPAPSGFGPLPPRKVEYEDVLKECDEIRGAHDRLVDRAVRAVALLRDKYDWKTRIEMEPEEPDELDLESRFGVHLHLNTMGGGGDAMDEDDLEDDDDDEGGSSDEDEERVEDLMGQTDAATPGGPGEADDNMQGVS